VRSNRKQLALVIIWGYTFLKSFQDMWDVGWCQCPSPLHSRFWRVCLASGWWGRLWGNRSVPRCSKNLFPVCCFILFQCVSILVHFLSFFGTRIPLDIHRLGRFYQGDEATIQFWFTFMNACKVSNPQQQDELNTYCISTAVAQFGAEPYSSWSEKPLGSPSGCECSWTTWELGP
jgi:hypothetical protein